MLYVVKDALLWTVSSLVPCTECPQQLECFTCNLGMHLLACFTQMKSSFSAPSPPGNKNQNWENGDCQDICFSVLQIQVKTLKWTYPFYLFYQLGTKSSLLCSIPTLELEEIWGIPSLLSTSCENDSSGIFSSKFYASLPSPPCTGISEVYRTCILIPLLREEEKQQLGLELTVSGRSYMGRYHFLNIYILSC